MNEMNDLPTPPSTPKLTSAEEGARQLYVLSVNLRAAKEAEASAKERRIEIEEMIAEIVPGPDIGQVTVSVKDGSKLVVTRGFNYKADLDGIRNVIAECNDRGMGIIVPTRSKTTHELDIRGYEWYKQSHPQIFAQLSQHVSITPKKVSVVPKSAKE